MSGGHCAMCRTRTCSSEVIKGHQRPSEAIRGHQRLSEVIKGHQRPSEAIRGHQRLSEVIRGHQRSLALTCAMCRSYESIFIGAVGVLVVHA